MDAKAVRQLRIGIGWILMVRGDAGWIVLAYWLDHILLFGSYHIGWIVSYWLDRIKKHWLLCAGWLLDGWDGWTGWDVGGMGVGWTDVSRRGSRSATIVGGTGAPPLALEGRQAVVSGGWHQLHQCCKDAEYLC